MSVTHLEIGGFRSFGTKQILRFGLPNGQPGSGLTVLVGPNNGGKSTVIDGLRLFMSNRSASFSESERNRAYGDIVEIALYEGDHLAAGTKTTADVPESGGYTKDFKDTDSLLVVPSRRIFDPFFAATGIGMSSRQDYGSSYDPQTRPEQVSTRFVNRLLTAYGSSDNREKFNKLLERVVDTPPKWMIDVSPQGQRYIKVIGEDYWYPSSGLGDGIVSLLFIIDSLYDSKPGDLIVIDEPELSLHPQHQRRLYSLFAEYSQDRQICYATHSPYFVSWDGISAGAEIARFHKDRTGNTNIFRPTRATVEAICKFRGNVNNPHALGLNANEVFFLSDHVVITEGQEDIVFLRLLSVKLGYDHDWSFFGWGAGGAENIRKIAKLLRELGYTKVAVILDGDKKAEASRVKEEYPGYCVVTIPADDIRTKQARKIAYKEGVFDEKYNIRREYEPGTRMVLEEVDNYLRDN